MMTFAKYARPVSILFAATFGFTLGACAHSQYRMDKVCEDYCQHIVDCNDNTNFNTCVNDCRDNVNGCDSDEDIEATLDILEDCTAQSCNQVGACIVEAWLECNL